MLGDIEHKEWFIISDIAGILRGLTSNVQLGHDHLPVPDRDRRLRRVAYPFGLRLRSAGEKPGAAESLGVSVLAMRCRHGHLGVFAGIGGAVIVFAGANRYQQGQTVGNRVPRAGGTRVRQLAPGRRGRRRCRVRLRPG